MVNEAVPPLGGDMGTLAPPASRVEVGQRDARTRHRVAMSAAQGTQTKAGEVHKVDVLHVGAFPQVLS